MALPDTCKARGASQQERGFYKTVISFALPTLVAPFNVFFFTPDLAFVFFLSAIVFSSAGKMNNRESAFARRFETVLDCSSGCLRRTAGKPRRY
jgi:hypothetical protein